MNHRSLSRAQGSKHVATAPQRRPWRLFAWLAAAVFATALMLGLAWGERAGWPWLVQPAADAVGKLMGRRVDVQGGQGASLHLWGGVRFGAAGLGIAGPDWAKTPWLLRLEDGELGVSYGALWRMAWGGPLEIERLRARRLEAWLSRQADGRASWQMGQQASTAKTSDEAGAPGMWRGLRVLDMSLQQGLLHVDDDVLQAHARVSLSVLPSGHEAWVWAARAEGRYRERPLSAQARSALPWRLSGERGVVMSAEVGRAKVSYDGQVPTEQSGRAELAGRFALSGPSLAAVGEALGITLPTTAAFQMQGSLRMQGPVTQVNVRQASIGQSRLSGDFTHTHSGQPPVLIGKLRGSRLMLADLGPAVGVSSPEVGGEPATDRVLPDRPFNLPSLGAMNADVNVDIDVFDSGATALQEMRNLRGRIVLKDSVLRFEQLSTQLAQGRVQGMLELDARDAKQAVFFADLHIGDVDVARWIKPLQREGKLPYLSGRLQGHLKASGRGRSTAEILGTLNGSADLALDDGQVSHLGVELAGLDLMEGAFEWLSGDDSLPVTCAQMQWVAHDGVLRPEPFIISTADSTLWADGQISLKDETMDLRARVAPKDFSLVALRTPVHLKGPWRNVEVKVVQARTWAKVLGAAALTAIHPLAGLAPLIDTGQQDAARKADQRCRQAKPGLPS